MVFTREIAAVGIKFADVDARRVASNLLHHQVKAPIVVFEAQGLTILKNSNFDVNAVTQRLLGFVT